MSFRPQQPLIERLQFVPPHICDWPGCKDASRNTFYNDRSPARGLARYCGRHTQSTLNDQYRGEHQI